MVKPLILKPIGRADVVSFLTAHRGQGLHVDDRLMSEVEKQGELFILELASADDFFRLVWQSCDATRPLTPTGQARTLKHCASRLKHFDWSFAALADAGNSWFSRCAQLDAEFDYSRFGWLAVFPVNDHEASENPGSRYYVFDGVHRFIVLAKEVLRQEVEFGVLQVLLMTPRR